MEHEGPGYEQGAVHEFRQALILELETIAMLLAGTSDTILLDVRLVQHWEDAHEVARAAARELGRFEAQSRRSRS